MRKRDEIRKAIDAVAWPEYVVDHFERIDLDSSGMPAVWVWVIVNDTAPKRKSFRSDAAEIRSNIRESLQKAGVEEWAYVRFRTKSEQKEVEAGTV